MSALNKYQLLKESITLLSYGMKSSYNIFTNDINVLLDKANDFYESINGARGLISYVLTSDVFTMYVKI